MATLSSPDCHRVVGVSHYSGQSGKTKRIIFKRRMISIETIANKLQNRVSFEYEKTAEWGNEFPNTDGKNQSPIDFVSNDAVFDKSLLERPLTVNYLMSRETDIMNDGTTLLLVPRNKGAISGGPFPPEHEYELAEIRVHWGSSHKKGSEHRVNGKAFPMEIQFIHWNSTLYPTLEKALGQPQGLAAICLFVQFGKENQMFKNIFNDNICDLIFKGRQKTVTSPFNPVWLLPDQDLRDYWTYEGSLTFPPCHENTTWIMFRYPLLLSNAQIDDFRRLQNFTKGDTPQTGSDGRLVDNFRTVQPMNGRVIRASFD